MQPVLVISPHDVGGSVCQKSEEEQSPERARQITAAPRSGEGESSRSETAKYLNDVGRQRALLLRSKQQEGADLKSQQQPCCPCDPPPHDCRRPLRAFPLLPRRELQPVRSHRIQQPPSPCKRLGAQRNESLLGFLTRFGIDRKSTRLN